MVGSSLGRNRCRWGTSGLSFRPNTQSRGTLLRRRLAPENPGSDRQVIAILTPQSEVCAHRGVITHANSLCH